MGISKYHKSLFLLVASFLLMGLLAACGDDNSKNTSTNKATPTATQASDTTATPTPTPTLTPTVAPVAFADLKVCSLITVDEMKTLAGESYESATDSDIAATKTKSCQYKPVAPTGSAISVQLNQGTAAEWSNYIKGLGAQETNVQIGDKAAYNDKLGTLAVLDGTVIHTISIVNLTMNADAKLELAKKIATVTVQKV